ncbi:MAG: 2-oxo acid dehydrogenase subunit E2 [Xanthobacteraceae bacterium]|nr:2-oxo acid dehydrogenase subunit E2 [Xanthobacteraceae bacterium]
MKWPLADRPQPFREIPFYNRYYLQAPRSSHVDPVIVMGTEIDADALLAFLQERNRGGGGPILTTAHVLIRAAALGLAQFPDMNTRVVGRRIYSFRNISVRMGFFHRKNKEINLMLIASANQKSVEQIAAEVWQRLLDSTRGTSGWDREIGRMRRLPPFMFRALVRLYGFFDRHFHVPSFGRVDELRSGAVMVNDLSYAGAPPMRGYKPSRFADGSDSLNLTLGPPENKVVMRDDQPVQIRVMPLFLRADHRLVDAYQIGRFLAFVREVMQTPERLNVTAAAPDSGARA